MNFKLLIVLLSCITLFACDDSAEDKVAPELLNVIKSNQQKWQASNIETYTITYYAPPNDCPTVDPHPAVEITVENNVITKLYVIELDVNLELGTLDFPTIDKLFEKMINSVEHIKGMPTFDNTFGYPVNYETDINNVECNGYSINILSFI